MPKNPFKKITIIFSLIFFGFLGLTCSNVSATTNDNYGLDTAAGNNDDKLGYGNKLANEQAMQEVSGMIGKALGGILALTGIIFFALMIYGGILWMTASGNEEQTKKAMSVITAAVVGIIIVASAYAITAYVGDALTRF